MGIGTALAEKIIRWAEKRGVELPRYGYSWQAGSDVYPEWSTERAIDEGYKIHYAVYAAASTIADAVKSVPWVVKRRTKYGDEQASDHPLFSVIRHPNPEKSWDSLVEAWDIYKSLAGNAYGLIVPAGSRMEIWPLRPDRILIQPDSLGHIAYYVYRVGDQEVKYAPEEILHFMFFDPGNDHFGLSPLQAAARVVDTSSSAMQWNYESMTHRARPDGMLSPQMELSPKQHKEYADAVKAQIAGKKNAHKIIIPPGPMDFKAFQMTPIEMDFVASFEHYEDAICKAYHLHPEALGKTGATYENKRWAIRAMWEGPVISRLNEMRTTLNHKLAAYFETSYPPGNGDVYIDYDLSGTPAVLAARQEAAEEAQKYWQMGVPFNEISQKLNLPFDPVDGLDVGYLPAMMLPVSSGSQTLSTRSINPTAEEQFAAQWRRIDRQREAWERGIAEKVRARFAEERKAVIKAVQSGSLDLDPVIDAQRDKWEELLLASWRAVIEFFGKQTMDDITGMRSIRAELDFDPWTEAIQSFTATQTAEHVTEITTTTKKGIRKAVVDGLDSGAGMAKIAAAIDEQFKIWEGLATGSRAMMIARTEVTSAAGFAQHEGAKQSGIVREKHWYDSGDDRVRDSHVMNTAAGWIPFDDLYPSGQMYPGDPAGGPDEVIDCRCIELFRTG